MSAIFGYTYTSCAPASDTSLRQLDHWNQPYGSDAADMRTIGNAGIGCRIEHFSEKFCWGGPLFEDHQYIAAVDALLFNRDELLSLLQLSEKTALSDEELLLRLIEQKGYHALSHVNGDFAGAIYDKSRKTWTLFRDHLGVRPLYYFFDSDIFVFSTDIRGVAALCGKKCRPNRQLIYDRFSGRNSLTLCLTDYEGILCVRPASFCRFTITDRGADMSEQIYWNLRSKKIRLKSDVEYHKELRRLIEDSIRRRLDAVQGPVGVEFSGGLDSSVIGILIHRFGREGIYYSWSESLDRLPLREGADERKVILDICSQEQISCKFHDGKKRISFETLLTDAYPSHTDTYKLGLGAQYMREQGARVVFTGHGGDEGVSHRCPPFELLYNREYLAYLRLYWDAFHGRRFRVLRTLKWSVMEAMRSARHFRSAFYDSSADRSELLDSAFAAQMRGISRDTNLYFHLAPHRYVIQGGTRQRMDNAAFQGAQNGMRYLFPYVDHRVMDFAVSIPRRLFIGSDRDRRIFRLAFADIIPTSLYDLNYKDYASKRGERLSEDRLDELNREIAVRELLDQDYWEGILNFDAINALAPPDSNNREAVAGILSCCAHLKRCVMIQNITEKATKREDDYV